MHKSRLGVVVIDCKTDDLADSAVFWGAALGCEARVDDEGRYAELVPDDGGVRVILQKVEHDSRVHLDIETDDIEAEVARLTRLGAIEVARIKRWVVLEAPTGQRFCVVRPQTRAFEEKARRWE